MASSIVEFSSMTVPALTEFLAVRGLFGFGKNKTELVALAYAAVELEIEVSLKTHIVLNHEKVVLRHLPITKFTQK